MNKIWHSKVPFKVSFLTWRIIKKKLPFQDTLHRFGINRHLTCFCCRSSQPETLQHVFVASETTFFLWNAIGNPLGITHNNEPVISVFKKWWDIIPMNKVHQWILHITPIFICYELWKQRCACRYGTQSLLYTLIV